MKNRLNAVKTAKEEADKKKAEEEAAAQAEAEEAVNTLEEKNGNVTDKEIQDAKEKIGKVTNPVKKQELESKLNKVEEAKAEFDKKKAAEAAAETAVADLEKPDAEVTDESVSYTHLTLPTTARRCRSRWSPYH